MATDDVHIAIASALDGRPEDVPEHAADGAAGDATLHLLALRALFERSMHNHEYDKALAVAKELLGSEPDNAAHLLRKGQACFRMEEYETAQDALEAAAKRFGDAPRGRTARMWLRRCQAELDAEEEQMDSRPSPEEHTGTAASKPSPSAAPAPAAAPHSASSSSSSSSSSSAPALVPQGYIRKRFDWFQTDGTVVVTILAKGARQPLPGSAVQLREEDGHQVLDVDVPHTPPGSSSSSSSSSPQGHDTENEQHCRLTLHLGGAVKGQPAVRATRFNVEVTLTKAASETWDDLQRSDKPKESMEVHGTVVGSGLRAPAASSEPTGPQPPPSSSSVSHKVKPRAPDEWASMEKELEEAAKDEEAPKGEDALQALFRQIYARGSPETRRAMNKSFQQSGGTTLSTNWDEVAQTDFSRDRKAPDGMEWKRFD